MAYDISLDLPPGFRGLDPDLPIDRYKRQLPHWRQKGATYFVTFRLADSLPQSKLEQLRVFREKIRVGMKKGDLNAEEALARSLFEKTEHWLDQGMGDCVLKNDRARRCLADSLMCFDSLRYAVFAYVIMPNHVHLLIRPASGFDLASILQSCKRFSATEINRQHGKSGSLWQIESFDRIVREAGHLWRCLQYIGKNPRKAGLGQGEYVRWVRPDWEEVGWGFVD